MDELIKMVSDKTGIGMDKARDAVDTVIGYLKNKLPGPIGDQVEGVVGKGPMAEGVISDRGGLASEARSKVEEVFKRQQ